MREESYFGEILDILAEFNVKATIMVMSHPDGQATVLVQRPLGPLDLTHPPSLPPSSLIGRNGIPVSSLVLCRKAMS